MTTNLGFKGHEFEDHLHSEEHSKNYVEHIREVSDVVWLVTVLWDIRYIMTLGFTELMYLYDIWWKVHWHQYQNFKYRSLCCHLSASLQEYLFKHSVHKQLIGQCQYSHTHGSVLKTRDQYCTSIIKIQRFLHLCLKTQPRCIIC